LPKDYSYTPASVGVFYSHPYKTYNAKLRPLIRKLGFDDTIHIPDSEHHLRHADSLPAAKNGTMAEFTDKVFKQ
jgi:hypothetical protein